MATFVVCWLALQTVWTQIRPYKTCLTHWWYSWKIFFEKQIIWKKKKKKNPQTTRTKNKNTQNYPACKKLILKLWHHLQITAFVETFSRSSKLIAFLLLNRFSFFFLQNCSFKYEFAFKVDLLLDVYCPLNCFLRWRHFEWNIILFFYKNGKKKMKNKQTRRPSFEELKTYRVPNIKMYMNGT